MIPGVQMMMSCRPRRKAVMPESGWVRKGEHKHDLARSVQTACDKNGVAFGYSVHPGNENNGKTGTDLMKKPELLDMDVVVGDSTQRPPAIAKLMEKQENLCVPCIGASSGI